MTCAWAFCVILPKEESVSAGLVVADQVFTGDSAVMRVPRLCSNGSVPCAPCTIQTPRYIDNAGILLYDSRREVNDARHGFLGSTRIPFLKGNCFWSLSAVLAVGTRSS